MAIESPDDIGNAWFENQFLVAVFDENPVPQSIVEVPYHALHAVLRLMWDEIGFGKQCGLGGHKIEQAEEQRGAVGNIVRDEVQRERRVQIQNPRDFFNRDAFPVEARGTVEKPLIGNGGSEFPTGAWSATS